MLLPETLIPEVGVMAFQLLVMFEKVTGAAEAALNALMLVAQITDRASLEKIRMEVSLGYATKRRRPILGKKGATQRKYAITQPRDWHQAILMVNDVQRVSLL